MNKITHFIPSTLVCRLPSSKQWCRKRHRTKQPRKPRKSILSAKRVLAVDLPSERTMWYHIRIWKWEFEWVINSQFFFFLKLTAISSWFISNVESNVNPVNKTLISKILYLQIYYCRLLYYQGWKAITNYIGNKEWHAILEFKTVNMIILSHTDNYLDDSSLIRPRIKNKNFIVFFPMGNLRSATNIGTT